MNETPDNFKNQLRRVQPKKDTLTFAKTEDQKQS